MNSSHETKKEKKLNETRIKIIINIYHEGQTLTNSLDQ